MNRNAKEKYQTEGKSGTFFISSTAGELRIHEM